MASILELKKQINDTEPDEVNIKPKLDIWVQHTRGRKYMTIIKGLNDTTKELKKMAGTLKKTFSTGGSVVIDPETKSENIALSGCIGKELRKYLVENNFTDDDKIEVHGG